MRLIEVLIPSENKRECDALLKNFHVVDKWVVPTDEDFISMKILVEDDASKEILSKLEKKYSGQRIVLYPVEGTLPKSKDEKKTPDNKIQVGRFISVSKEELYDDIEKPVNLSVNFLLMVILSAIVAGIGILRNNQAIIIGAMVIAPFLSPNMSLAFGTTLGDVSIIRRSAIVGVIATIIAFGISVLWGVMTPDFSLVALDAAIESQDIILALVCGFAGVLSVLSGQGSTLVGVMVAAALLPPLMRAGLLIGGGLMSDGINSFLIFTANIISLNLAGIITFYFAGIRPNRWYESKVAIKRTRIAFAVWIVALVLLIGAMLLMRKIF